MEFKELQKMNINRLNNQNLLAPCGLYCGECEAFQDGRCGGCISRKGLCLKYSKICKIFDCCINDRNFRFCSECQIFPCRNFKFFELEDEEYDWPAEVTQNLQKIRSVGIEHFLKEQVKRVKKLIECANKKKVKHCAQCKDWPCEKLQRPPLGPA